MNPILKFFNTFNTTTTEPIEKCPEDNISINVQKTGGIFLADMMRRQNEQLIMPRDGILANQLIIEPPKIDMDSICIVSP